MDNAMNQNKGFTLIELMAVVAIVSILAVIALPAYLDYVVRGKVSEGMVFASEAKTSVSEYYYSTKSIPSDNTAAVAVSLFQ
jgi:type IV pilus assembly protein PilA